MKKGTGPQIWQGRKTLVRARQAATATVGWMVLKNAKFNLRVLHINYLYFIRYLPLVYF